MHIGLDYTAALRQGAGIGRYTRGIVGALARLDHANQYTLIVPADIGALPHSIGEGQMRMQRLPLPEWPLTIAWHRLRLPLYVELFTGALDLFHSPDFVLPPVHRARTIITVHDLSFLRFPQCAARGLVEYLSAVVPRSLRRADLVLADSAWTRQDLIEMLHVAAEKIVVVPAGVGPEYHPISDQATLAAVRERYNLPRRFLLHVGTLEPRKNLIRLMEALRAIADRDPELCLVLVGGKGWLYEDIFASVARLGLAGRVIFPGYIAEADLPAVYNLAEALAYPSLYEGFGIPPLEAMACGVPVVSSNSSSLPEVVGDAALLVEPTDTAALADALLRALSDNELRQTLRRRGLERAAAFSWPAAAQKLLDAYKTCVSG